MSASVDRQLGEHRDTKLQPVIHFVVLLTMLDDVCRVIGIDIDRMFTYK